MKCPNCQNRKFDVYEARGYTSKESPIKECECGHVWRLIPLEGGNKRIDTIKQGENIDLSHARICNYIEQNNLNLTSAPLLASIFK